MTARAYKLLEDQFSHWCLGRDDVLAVIVVGSRGRVEEADDYADLDLILFTTDAAKLVTNADWISNFSTPWLTLLNQAGQDPEWFVIVDEGLKIDILVRQVSLPGNLNDWLLLFPYQDVLARGYRLLIDKSKAQKLLPMTGSKVLPEIDFPIFLNTLEEILVAMHRAAKFAHRSELWRAQHEIAEIRKYLLKFYEWHASVESNGLLDTWYSGRHLMSWLDDSALEKLPELFPSYNQKEVINALAVILLEVTRVSDGIIRLLNFPANSQGLAYFQTWLKDFILAGS